MSDFGDDSAVTRAADGTVLARVSPAWDGFGPNGGFLATLALRAAGECAEGIPASTIHCQFLNAPEHGEIGFTVTPLARSTRSVTIEVIGRQPGRAVLAALVRAVRPAPAGRTLALDRPPDVPGPELLRPTEELLPAKLLHLVPMTRNFEVRPVTWERSWPPPPGRRPAYLGWCRFRPTPVFADPLVAAGRALVLLDSYVWAAVERGTEGGGGLWARSTDLSVTILDPGVAEEWLLCDVTVVRLGHGSITAAGTVWSPGGAALATGQMNMVYTQTRDCEDGRQ